MPEFWTDVSFSRIYLGVKYIFNALFKIARLIDIPYQCCHFVGKCWNLTKNLQFFTKFYTNFIFHATKKLYNFLFYIFCNVINGNDRNKFFECFGSPIPWAANVLHYFKKIKRFLRTKSIHTTCPSFTTHNVKIIQLYKIEYWDIRYIYSQL